MVVELAWQKKKKKRFTFILCHPCVGIDKKTKRSFNSKPCLQTHAECSRQLLVSSCENDSMTDLAVTSLQDDRDNRSPAWDRKTNLVWRSPPASWSPTAWPWQRSWCQSYGQMEMGLLPVGQFDLYCMGFIIMTQTQKGCTNLQLQEGMGVPAACVPAHSSCSQTLLYPPQNTAGR